MRIMKKEIDLFNSPILYSKKFYSSDDLARDWTIYKSEWYVDDGWLVGKNRGNYPGMIISNDNYPGNVLVEFSARTVLPCTHDINFMWNGSWNETKNDRDFAYVAGLQGWWEGKVGIEKSPYYKLNAGTPLFSFEPGKDYFIQGGSIDGHCFIFIDGALALEVTDPDPIDSLVHKKVGFEAYCSHIQICNVTIRNIAWHPVDDIYIPEF